MKNSQTRPSDVLVEVFVESLAGDTWRVSPGPETRQSDGDVMRRGFARSEWRYTGDMSQISSDLGAGSHRR